jgi:hypothetical protein
MKHTQWCIVSVELATVAAAAAAGGGGVCCEVCAYHTAAAAMQIARQDSNQGCKKQNTTAGAVLDGGLLLQLLHELQQTATQQHATVSACISSQVTAAYLRLHLLLPACAHLLHD